MQWNDLKNVQKDAPESGCFAAYTREKLLFHRYTALDEVKAVLQEKELLELHLFDAKREYRAVKTASRRYSSGVIEAVTEAGSDEEKASSYCETVWLEPSLRSEGLDRIQVFHEITYDEKGMLTITNYRLALM